MLNCRHSPLARTAPTGFKRPTFRSAHIRRHEPKATKEESLQARINARLKSSEKSSPPRPPKPEPQPQTPFEPIVKKWIDAARVFAPPVMAKLSRRHMGTIEKTLAKLNHAGMQTVSVRVFRMRMFILEEPMLKALRMVQNARPELFGTILVDQELSPPERYVDTFSDPSELEESEKEMENFDSRDLVKAELRNAPVKMPTTLVPIAFDVVEGSDSSQYLEEVTNMLNTPFDTGAPLVKVALVRHDGGTDLLIGGHQALFDEASLDMFCHEVLEMYDKASEGRLGTVQPGHMPMLASVDSLYPPKVIEMLHRPKSWFYTKVDVEELAHQGQWRRLPSAHHLHQLQHLTPASNSANQYIASNTSYSAPPLLPPPLNACVAMFGRLTPEQTKTLTGACKRENIQLDDIVNAAATTAIAQTIYKADELARKLYPTESDQIYPHTPSPSDKPSKGNKLKNSKKEEPLVTAVPMLVWNIMSLRRSFDPEIAPTIIGALSSYSIAPIEGLLAVNPGDVSSKAMATAKRRLLWKAAKDSSQASKEANLTQSCFSDLYILPILADMCASEKKWQHQAIPCAVIGETSFTHLAPTDRLRFQLYDTKSVSSCWTPGVSVSSHIDGDTLGISLSFRKPLISDKTAHEILSGILSRLTSLL